jgi:hypothetical protein
MYAMNRVTQILNSTAAARLSTIVLLAALAGLLTHGYLTLQYGDSAPVGDAGHSGVVMPASKPAPAWLTGGSDALVSSAPSDIKLLGVVAQGATGYALIQTAGKRAQVLLVGQALADGTQLLSVSGKSAVFNVHGTPQLLSLDPSSGAAAANMAAPTPTQGAQPDAAAQVALQQAQLQQAQMQQVQMQQAQQAHQAQQAQDLQQAQMQHIQQMQAAALQAQPGGVESAKGEDAGMGGSMRRRMVRP